MQGPVNGGRNSIKTVGVKKFGYMLETLVESQLRLGTTKRDNVEGRDNQQERFNLITL